MDLSGMVGLTRDLLAAPTSGFYPDSHIVSWINIKKDDLCGKADVLEALVTTSLQQSVADYNLPSDYTRMKRLEIIKGNSKYECYPQDLKEQDYGVVRQTANPPEGYNIWEGKLRLDARPNVGSYTGALSAGVATGGTEFSVKSAAGLPKMGRMLIDDEVMGWWRLSGNTCVTLSKGLEGTTDASHAVNATCFFRDTYIYYNKKDSDLSSMDSSFNIPDQFHPGMCYGAASIGRNKSKDYELAQYFESKYDSTVQTAYDWSHYKWRRNYRPK